MLRYLSALLVVVFLAGFIRISSAQVRQSGDASAAALTHARAFPSFVDGRSSTISAPAAFGLSIILPGLGQRYVTGGSFGGWGTVFAVTDAGLWISLFTGEWRRDQIQQSYTALAAGSAGADVQGKDRTFFLNLATYRSSDEFLETVLRNRAWNQIGYVSSPSFHWNWTNEDDFFRYRALREDSESLRRRRGIIVASLVANRLISGIMAAWRASRLNRESVAVQFGPPPAYGLLPQMELAIWF